MFVSAPNRETFMDKLLAKLSLAELITEERWPAFTEWLEAGDESGHCAHDQSDYEDWFREQGEADPSHCAEEAWNALSLIAQGPCRCVAGGGIWTGKELQDLKQPVLYARPLDLPRELTGLPEHPSEAQTLLYSRFYGAVRGRLGSFWKAVPEPAFSGDVKEGMAFAAAMAKTAVLSPNHERIVHTAKRRMNFFFHSAEFDVVKDWLALNGHELIDFNAVLKDLCIYVLRQEDGTPAQNVRLLINGEPQGPAVDGFEHWVLIRPEEQTVFADGRWHPLPVGGIEVHTEGASMTLSESPEAGVHEVVVSSP